MRTYLACLLAVSVNVNADAVDLIKSEEGYSSTVYIDTEGHPTIGYGFKVTSPMMGDVILKEDAELMLIDLVTVIQERLERNKVYLALPVEKRNIIISMVYQMGYKGVMKFKDMWKALGIGDYDSAGLAMQDSLWYVQTPNRAKRHIDVIRGK